MSILPPRHHRPWEDSMHHRPHKPQNPPPRHGDQTGTHPPPSSFSSSSSSSVSVLITSPCNPTLPRSVLSTRRHHHHKTTHPPPPPPPPPPTAHSINVLKPPAAPSSSLPSSPRILCKQSLPWIPQSEMSVEVAPEHVCYVHCNFCNTILAVSVPSNSLFNIVTVRCGHCANLLSVNMGALLQTLPHQDFQNHNLRALDYVAERGSSSKCNTLPMMSSITDHNDQLQMLHMRPPEKRQRVPSAYNRFIKEEIQRIKANNPDISHREAFSAAAKNWAHLPHIHFGLNLENNKRVKLDEAIAAEKSQGFY